MIETDPVDAVAAAPGVAVAKLDSPLRQLAFRNIAQGAFHRAALLRHAARLPLAIDADVEGDWVAEDGPPLGGRRGLEQGQSNDRQNPFHRPAEALACRRQKKSGGAEAPPLWSLPLESLVQGIADVVERRIQLVADALH